MRVRQPATLDATAERLRYLVRCERWPAACRWWVGWAVSTLALRPCDGSCHCAGKEHALRLRWLTVLNACADRHLVKHEDRPIARRW